MQIISGFTGQIIIKLSPYGRYLIVDYGSGLYFYHSRDVAMATNFKVKIGEIGLFTFIRYPGIQKRIAT